MRTARRRAGLLATIALLLPGCLLGSPLAAISGAPYGMVIDDAKAGTVLLVTTTL